MIDVWLDKEQPVQEIEWKKLKKKNRRIRILQGRVTRLEEEVRTLTRAMNERNLAQPIQPWDDSRVRYGPLPIINTGGPAQNAGTFREEG